MARLTILEAPHPILKAKAAPVERFDDALRKLLDDMLETMYAAPGIGLAAPQVGVTKRAIVADLAPKDEERRPLRIINPRITWRSSEQAVAEEGCLSLPEQFADVRRHVGIRIAFQDETGTPQELDAGELFARCLQHEVDHLDGILFVDHLSALKRGMLMRKLVKSRRARA